MHIAKMNCPTFVFISSYGSKSDILRNKPGMHLIHNIITVHIHTYMPLSIYIYIYMDIKHNVMQGENINVHIYTNKSKSMCIYKINHCPNHNENWTGS